MLAAARRGAEVARSVRRRRRAVPNLEVLSWRSSLHSSSSSALLPGHLLSRTQQRNGSTDDTTTTTGLKSVPAQQRSDDRFPLLRRSPAVRAPPLLLQRLLPDTASASSSASYSKKASTMDSLLSSITNSAAAAPINVMAWGGPNPFSPPLDRGQGTAATSLLQLHNHRTTRTWNQQQHPLAAVLRLQQQGSSSFFSTQSDDGGKKPKPKKQKAAPSPQRRPPTRVPTPPSAPPPNPSTFDKLRQTTPKGVLHKGLDLTVSLFKAAVNFLLRLPGNTFYYLTHPDDLKQALSNLKQKASDEVNHYWVGFKLLWADMQTARNLVGRTLQGSTLTRRERNQLLRTVTDLFRLIPFSMFIIIPFMEFALPFALMLFPNMLPSTFQDSLKAEESMKRELQSRIAMAQFFQETMEELAKKQKRKASKRKKELAEAGVSPEEAGDAIDAQEDSAASMLEFLEKARNGEMVPPDVLIRYANYFHDDLTLDNMPRMQLINMCKYMGISPYGSEAFLRFQLRHRIRVLKEDDQRILWEGIDSLTKMELREACQERGMRSTGLSKDAYKHSLQQWLDLSVNKNVPISLLIMSRTFFLRDEVVERKEDEESKSLAGLADAISGLDKEVVDQVILEVATSEEKLSDPDIRKLKLEVVSKQNELIRVEQAEREAATKRKEAAVPDKSDLGSGEVPEVDMSSGAAEAKPLTADFVDAAGTETHESKPELEAEEDRDLSTEEMDAISQLVSDDPVSKERAELERIKAAMRSEEADEAQVVTEAADSAASKEGKMGEPYVISHPMPSSEDFSDGTVFDAAPHKKAEREAEAASKESAKEAEISDQPPTGESDEIEEEDDPVVAKLKKRVESMIDKIEVSLSEVQVKIGDKLHFLDKDRDGVLSREEMAEVLQQVLKRKITVEEAMEIASAMDENRDGVFTVEELIQWIDEHKLVKFVEEGRDADMDRIIESHSHDQQKDEEATAATKGKSK